MPRDSEGRPNSRTDEKELAANYPKRRSSTVSKTGTSVRNVASLRKSNASSQEANNVSASGRAFRIEGGHSFQSFGICSRWGYTDKVEAAAFFPQPFTPGKPSALSPTRAR